PPPRTRSCRSGSCPGTWSWRELRVGTGAENTPHHTSAGVASAAIIASVATLAACPHALVRLRTATRHWKRQSRLKPLLRAPGGIGAGGEAEARPLQPPCKRGWQQPEQEPRPRRAGDGGNRIRGRLRSRRRTGNRERGVAQLGQAPRRVGIDGGNV